LILEETETRVAELGLSLGYWAGSFRKLPGILGSITSGTYTPLEALFHIKWQHKEQLPHFPSIDHGLSGLERFSPFAGVINLIKIPEALAVVLPSALRSFISLLEPTQANALLRYGWQFAGAMYAIYGRVNPVEESPITEENPEELIDDAAASRNEYAVIFADACLREYAVQPDTIYFAAAREAILLLPDSTSQRGSVEDQ
jgi:hypothetical protein